MPDRFVVEFDEAANEGRLRPRERFDWPPDLFVKMRQTFQCSWSHDQTRTFAGTIPQIEAAVRWLEREGLRVGAAGEAASSAHPPVVCAACDLAYRTRNLPQAGSPCEACEKPLRFVCETPHDGACEWRVGAE